MEMSIALQVALFCASVAIVVLVVCLIPVAFKVRSSAEQLIHQIEELKTNTQALAKDTRELVSNLSDLTRRANQQMDDIGEIVRTARHWAERADRIVTEVGNAVETPVFSLLRNFSVIRKGAGTFFNAFFHANKNPSEPGDHHE